MMLREILRNSRKRKLCSYKFQGSKMTEVENQVWVCLSCKNENNRDAVYFWKTQIYKEIDAEVREKKHGEGESKGESSGWAPRERCSLQGEWRSQ